MIWWRAPLAQTAETRAIRCLLLFASCGLLARMAFNPQIYRTGYCQASLAGVIAVVTAWKMIPDFFNLTRSARAAYLASLSIFLATGVWQLQSFSIGVYSKKNQPLGTGADQIYGFDANVEPTTALLEEARKTLAAAGRDSQLPSSEENSELCLHVPSRLAEITGTHPGRNQ